MARVGDHFGDFALDAALAARLDLERRLPRALVSIGSRMEGKGERGASEGVRYRRRRHDEEGGGSDPRAGGRRRRRRRRRFRGEDSRRARGRS